MGHLIIPGEVPPSKKNSKQIKVGYGGRRYIASSDNYQAWNEATLWELKGVEPFDDTSEIVLVFYPKTKRACDLTNKAESVMDTLVDAGLIEDDNWFVCGDIRLRFGGIDKVNPRVEIIYGKQTSESNHLV